MAGKAGSLLIDIAANTAQLKKDLDEAKGQLSGFGEQIATLATRVTGAIAGFLAVDKIKAFAEEVNRAGISAQETANKYKLTAEQVQALQVISRRTGQSLDDLVKSGKANAEWLQLVTDEAKRAGQVIDNEYTAALKRMADESEEANKRLLVLFAPAVTATKSWIADALERIAKDLAAVASHQSVLDSIAGILRMLTFSGSTGSAQDFQLGERVREAENAAQVLKDLEKQQQQSAIGMGYPVLPETMAKARKEAEAAAVALGQYKDAQRRAGYGSALDQLPPTVVEGKTGGGVTDDRFARTLQSLKDQADAVQAGIATLAASSGLATKEAERLAQLQIDIGTRTAQAIKAARTSDPGQKDQLAAAAKQLEELKASYADLKATQATADGVNEKYADGTKKLADQLFYLDKAYAAGLIGITEYTAAVRDYNDAAAQQQEKHEGLKGGVEGVAAGFRSGLRGMSDQLSEFKMGQELFTNSFNLMSGAISEFVKTGTVDFAKFAQSFAAMLADMAARWAAQELLKAGMRLIGSALGGGGGSLSAGSGTIMSAPAPPASGGFRATGGSVDPFRTYTVGEAGPERFTPAMAGRIEPNGGRDGGSVTVNLDMGKTEGARDPSAALEFGRKVKAAVVQVIANEKRPGGSLYQTA